MMNFVTYKTGNTNIQTVLKFSQKHKCKFFRNKKNVINIKIKTVQAIKLSSENKPFIFLLSKEYAKYSL